MALFVNPPWWVENVLINNWEFLKQNIGERFLPDNPKAAEYGCGLYGCVIPTKTRGMVLKITSDSTEGKFVESLSKIKNIVGKNVFEENTAGLVRYKEVIRFDEEYKNRRIYGLLREESELIGLRQASSMFGDPNYFLPQAKLLNEYKGAWDAIWNMFVFEQKQGSDRFASEIGEMVRSGEYENIALNYAMETLDMLESYPEMVPIVKTLRFFMKFGMVITDVHAGNFGVVRRKTRKKLVIIDPGNIIFL